VLHDANGGHAVHHMYVARTIRAADPVDSYVQARTAPKPAGRRFGRWAAAGSDCGPAI